jgi:hypothetical protein
MKFVGNGRLDEFPEVTRRETILSLTLAAALATILNFGIFTLVAIWYVAP